MFLRMILVVAALKGGVGKTTTSVYLAAIATASRRTVTLVDADAQASTAEWIEGAEDEHLEPVTLVEAPTERLLTKALDRLQPDEVGIVDTPPGSQRMLEKAIAAADCVVVPTRVGGVETARAEEVFEMVPRKTPAGLVISSARTYTRDYRRRDRGVAHRRRPGLGVGARARHDRGRSERMARRRRARRLSERVASCIAVAARNVTASRHAACAVRHATRIVNRRGPGFGETLHRGGWSIRSNDTRWTLQPASPASIATRAAAVRLRTPSLVKMLLRCRLAVLRPTSTVVVRANRHLPPRRPHSSRVRGPCRRSCARLHRVDRAPRQGVDRRRQGHVRRDLPLHRPGVGRPQPGHRPVSLHDNQRGVRRALGP